MFLTNGIYFLLRLYGAWNSRQRSQKTASKLHAESDFQNRLPFNPSTRPLLFCWRNQYGCSEAATLTSAASPLGVKKHYRNPLTFPRFFTSLFLGCYGFAHLPLECVFLLFSLKMDWIWFERLGIPKTHKTGLRFSNATVPLQLVLVIKNAYYWRN